MVPCHKHLKKKKKNLHKFPNCGSQASHISFTWGFIRNANFQAPPLSYRIRNSEVGPVISILTRPSQNSNTHTISEPLCLCYLKCAKWTRKAESHALKQHLHFDKISRWFTHLLRLEGHRSTWRTHLLNPVFSSSPLPWNCSSQGH